MEITSLLSCIFSHFLNKILSYVLLSWLKGFWEVHWILMKMEFWIAKKTLKNKSLQCYSALCCTLTLKISYKNTVVLKHRIESIVCTVWVSDKFSNTVTRKDSAEYLKRWISNRKEKNKTCTWIILRTNFS